MNDDSLDLAGFRDKRTIFARLLPNIAIVPPVAIVTRLC